LEKTRYEHIRHTQTHDSWSHKPICKCNIQHITCQAGKGVGVGEEPFL